MKQNIFLGPAGSPDKSTIDGLDSVFNMGLQAMEVEFVYGVKMSLDLAKKIKESAIEEKE